MRETQSDLRITVSALAISIKVQWQSFTGTIDMHAKSTIYLRLKSTHIFKLINSDLVIALLHVKHQHSQLEGWVSEMLTPQRVEGACPLVDVDSGVRYSRCCFDCQKIAHQSMIDYHWHKQRGGCKDSKYCVTWWG